MNDVFFFFFQAEDGIRDWSVTGVQTCALPISSSRAKSTIPVLSDTLISARRMFTSPSSFGSVIVIVPACNSTLIDALEVCDARSEEHTSELQSLTNLVCRLLLEKKTSRCGRQF